MVDNCNKSLLVTRIKGRYRLMIEPFDRLKCYSKYMSFVLYHVNEKDMSFFICVNIMKILSIEFEY